MPPSKRAPEQMRSISFTRNYTKHAPGSVLVTCGDTQVICTASVPEGVPRGMGKDASSGWITADTALLLRSTNTRMGREAAHASKVVAPCRSIG